MEKWGKRDSAGRNEPHQVGTGSGAEMAKELQNWTDSHLSVASSSHSDSLQLKPGGQACLDRVLSAGGVSGCTHREETHSWPSEDWEVSQDWALEQKVAVHTRPPEGTDGILRNKWRDADCP